MSGSALGCWTCGTVSRIDTADPRRLRMLTFFAEHEAHRPWIDLTGRLPEPSAPVD